jgi:hypothetical protein
MPYGYSRHAPQSLLALSFLFQTAEFPFDRKQFENIPNACQEMLRNTHLNNKICHYKYFEENLNIDDGHNQLNYDYHHMNLTTNNSYVLARY